MRAILLQTYVDHGQPFHRRVAEMCDQVLAHQDADLVVLPELWATGYFAFDDYARTAEPLDGPTGQALSETAKAAGLHLHAGSLVERGPAGLLYNTSLLYGPDGRLRHAYRKFHLFGHNSREAALLTAGDMPACADTAWGTLGMATCYDLRFPELFRVLADDGAGILLVTAAWPAVRVDHWRLLVQARALENQAYVLACNAAGRQGDVELGGHSMVVDPGGRVTAQAGPGPEALVVDIDPEAVTQARAAFPAFTDRRLAVVNRPR